MRDSAVNDAVIAELLGLSSMDQDGRIADRIVQRLDGLERHYKGPGARRDSRARADLGFAIRRLRDAGKALSTSGGVDVWRDPRWLRAFLAFLRAHKEIARAEAQTGDYSAWLPTFMRDDPIAELQTEIDRTRALLREIDRDRKVKARAEVNRRLRIGSQRPMTTDEYAKLSRAERTAIEREYGLEEPDGLKKFDPQYHEDLAA